MPEYPGTDISPTVGIQLEHKCSGNLLIDLAVVNEIEVIFAPSSQSAELEHKTFEYILVACWPYLISPNVYCKASKAALNLHPSLLPKYRGANPVDEQIKYGENQLGITLHELDQSFDTGPVVRQASFELSKDSYNRQNIEYRAARFGAALFIQAIESNYAARR
ncbi:MAG: hypothetical protein GY820_15285 [Gammaproteobacteria bacterium]|nr:hypothetical protein [Gammaproteobacteria bacterium]